MFREHEYHRRLISEARSHGVDVTEETAGHGLDRWDSCRLRIRRDGSLTIQGMNGSGDWVSTEWWDSRKAEACADLDSVRPIDLLEGMRLSGWDRCRQWLIACWAELEGEKGELSIGPIRGWAHAIAHLGRALSRWGGDDPTIV